MARLTSAEEQKIIELYMTRVNGRWPTTSAIAEQVGRSRTAVENCVQRAGVARRRKPRLTEKEKRRIIDLYQTRNGTRWTSTLAISRLVHRPPSTIHRVVTEAGINRTVSDALTAYVTDALRQRIIHLYRTTGWSYPKVAEYLKIGSKVTYDVLDAANVIVRQGPNRVAKVRVGEAKQIAALYSSGLSSREVAERTGRTRSVVETIIRDAKILRSRQEAARMAAVRRRARARLADILMGPIVGRWQEGVAVDVLAAEMEVPPDLLWDAMVGDLATHMPGFSTRGRKDCVGTQCILGCVAVCALVATAGRSSRR